MLLFILRTHYKHVLFRFIFVWLLKLWWWHGLDSWPSVVMTFVDLWAATHLWRCRTMFCGPKMLSLGYSVFRWFQVVFIFCVQLRIECSFAVLYAESSQALLTHGSCFRLLCAMHCFKTLSWFWIDNGYRLLSISTFDVWTANFWFSIMVDKQWWILTNNPYHGVWIGRSQIQRILGSCHEVGVVPAMHKPPFQRRSPRANYTITILIS